jgi:hypothetical protein
MVRSWTGFLPQNEVVKLQWHVMETCTDEKMRKAVQKYWQEQRAAASPDQESGEEPGNVWEEEA